MMTADIKYPVLIRVEIDLHDPGAAPHVASTGLHHTSLRMIVANEAHVDNIAIK